MMRPSRIPPPTTKGINRRPPLDGPEARFHPFGRRAELSSALYLGFDDADDFPEVDLLLAFVAVEEEAPEAFHCPGFRAVSSAASELAWEYWNGTAWRPLAMLSDDTLGLARSGLVELRVPGIDTGAKSDLNGNFADGDRYWIRARLVRNAYEQAPELHLVRHNTAPATQAETVVDEVLGGSDGSRGLELELESRPVLASDDEPSRAAATGWRRSSLELEVYEVGGDEPVVWEEVQDFLGSAPDARQFVLNRTTGRVRFGDGVCGSIPPVNPDRPASNIVARHYRNGGGAAGNVAAGAIDTLVLSIPGIDAGGVTNVLAATGGADEETFEEARQRAPRAIKSRWRSP